MTLLSMAQVVLRVTFTLAIISQARTIDDPAWAAELKLDGYHGLLFIGCGKSLFKTVCEMDLKGRGVQAAGSL
jgi:hypothetical protein